MPRRSLYTVLGLALLLAVAARWISDSRQASPDIPLVKARDVIETAPMCPWRQPEADLRAFFPDATRYETDVLILTGARLELAKRLGRTPTPEEHSLYVYRVYHQQHRLGAVLTRRVKGEYGAIEIVVAVDAKASVRGVRLQRLREPEPTANALRSRQWLTAFEGKTPAGDWQLGGDIPDTPSAARVSARAVVEGVRSLLILLETAEQHGIPKARPTEHH